MTNTQNSTHSFGCEICKDQGFIVGDNNTVAICDCRKAFDHQRPSMEPRPFSRGYPYPC
jgi:hypothetical protein